MKKIRARLILLITVTLFSIILSIPSFPSIYEPLPSWVKQVLSDRGLTLGLDLQGGIHQVLEVEEDRAVEIAVDRSKKALEELFADKAIITDGVSREGSTKLVIALSGDEEKKNEIVNMVDESFPSYEVEDSSETQLVYELRGTEVDRIKNSAINQALETIRNRIDQFGVAEPLIQRLGRNQIAIQLPGIKDPQRAKASDSGDRVT